MTGLKYLAAAICLLPIVAAGQSINIDMDVQFGPPQVGNGAPSSSFGAAAGQPGLWNRLSDITGKPLPLTGLNGQKTQATILKTADNPGGTGGFNFKGSTGDYALLLNDAEAVATIASGGTLTYTLSGLLPGLYDVYTYAVPISGIQVNTPVHVPEALSSHAQVVTGPMPGNAFEYLVTHSIHSVLLLTGSSFNISLTQPPQSHAAMHVNGIQIVAVPEPTSFTLLSFFCTAVFFRFKFTKRGSQ